MRSDLELACQRADAAYEEAEEVKWEVEQIKAELKLDSPKSASRLSLRPAVRFSSPYGGIT